MYSIHSISLDKLLNLGYYNVEKECQKHSNGTNVDWMKRKNSEDLLTGVMHRMYKEFKMR